MKTDKQVVLILMSLIAIFMTGCEMFDEGGLVSKADKRISAHSWQLSQYLRNGNDETSLLLISGFNETFMDNGSVMRSYTDKDGNVDSETGTWTFDSGNNQIKLTGLSSIELTDQSSTVTSSVYNILRLKKDEMWYYYDNGGARHEFHFIKK